MSSFFVCSLHLTHASVTEFNMLHDGKAYDWFGHKLECEILKKRDCDLFFYMNLQPKTLISI